MAFSYLETKLLQLSTAISLFWRDCPASKAAILSGISSQQGLNSTKKQLQVSHRRGGNDIRTGESLAEADFIL